MEPFIRRRTLRINTLTGSYKGLWEELRLKAPFPPRRCNHSACIINNKLVIYGGQDISEGVFNDTWVLIINPDEPANERWFTVEGTGECPGPLCRHSAIVYKDLIYIFGGNDGTYENNSVYSFNLECTQWNKFESNIIGIDSHSAVLYENKMIIFGGYQGGSQINDTYVLNLDTMSWSKPELNIKPRERAYHRSAVYSNSMWMYGGTCSSGDHMQDMWKLDLDTWSWQEIVYTGDSPGVVSGHSVCVYGDVMLVFGGIKDMLKETNEMYTYDFNANNWVLIQTETEINDPVTSLDAANIKEKKKTERKSEENESVTKELNKSKTIKTAKSQKAKLIKQTSAESPVKKIYHGPTAIKRGRIRGNVPHSRDGHSANLYENYMIIFGGDRYQMPFNDIYAYSINERLLKK